MDNSINADSKPPSKKGRKPKSAGNVSPRTRGLGESFKAARNATKMSQYHVADGLERWYGEAVGAGYISRLENGRVNPSFGIVAALCKFLDVPIEELAEDWLKEAAE